MGQGNFAWACSQKSSLDSSWLLQRRKMIVENRWNRWYHDNLMIIPVFIIPIDEADKKLMKFTHSNFFHPEITNEDASEIGLLDAWHLWRADSLQRPRRQLWKPDKCLCLMGADWPTLDRLPKSTLSNIYIYICIYIYMCVCIYIYIYYFPPIEICVYIEIYINICQSWYTSHCRPCLVPELLEVAHLNFFDFGRFGA